MFKIFSFFGKPRNEQHKHKSLTIPIPFSTTTFNTTYKMHKPTHAALQITSSKSGKVYDTRGVRWYIREKKLDAGYLQYNLYVEQDENGGSGYRNKGRILRVINRKKNFRGVELCCDTGSYMVTLVKAIPDKFPPELKAELSTHQEHTARNALFCSKLFKVFYLV